jgi:hypothetical protein
MSNTHFKEKGMTLKAKGLLSLMLSLPDTWDYSIKGLCAICVEKESAIKATLNELQDFGYLAITKLFPNETDSGRIEYVYDIYETPQKQEVEKQGVENQGVDFQAVENPAQLNTKRSIPKQSRTKQSSNKDIGNTRKRFVPPSLEEIRAYCLERKNNVDPQKFYDYFTASDWVDSKGNKVKNWKQKVITWESNTSSNTAPRREVPKKSSTDDFMDKLKAMYQANLEGDK